MIILVQEVTVEGEITLGQFLKTEGIIESGGQAKWFLQDYDVLLNGERETRRGKKLADQDVSTSLIFQISIHLLLFIKVSNEA